LAIEALRTPDERFAFLPRFPHAPSYADDLPGYESLRMAWVDVGDAAAEHVFLCLHGEPTWSYLYRKMIPVFVGAGHRVVAPDLFGFGRSDKPVDDAVYSFDFHRDSLLRLIERLDLRNVVLVCQDWGGLLGLTLPMDMPDRFRRLLVMNTAIPVGEPLSDGFAAWKGFAASVPEIPVAALTLRYEGGVVMAGDRRATEVSLDVWRAYQDLQTQGQSLTTTEELVASAQESYNAALARYKAGVGAFPQRVPVEPGMPGIEHGRRARAFFANDWRGESFMAVGLRDGVLGGPVMAALRETIRGCPEPMEVPEAGHFVQEYGEPIARRALEHFGLG